MTRGEAQDALRQLPPVFTYAQGRETVGGRQLQRLHSDGAVTRIARGLYRIADVDIDEELSMIAAKLPEAVLCLRSALAFHDLIDDIPPSYDIAVPRNTWTPTMDFPVTWHHFDVKTYALGRTQLDLAPGVGLGIYSKARSIVDAFRLAHLEGPELGNGALRRWLRGGGQPSELLLMASAFPRTEPVLRRSLEILL